MAEFTFHVFLLIFLRRKMVGDTRFETGIQSVAGSTKISGRYFWGRQRRSPKGRGPGRPEPILPQEAIYKSVHQLEEALIQKKMNSSDIPKLGPTGS